MLGGVGEFIIALVIIGAILYFIQSVEWIDPTIKLLIKLILIVIIVVWGIRLLLPMAGIS